MAPRRRSKGKVDRDAEEEEKERARMVVFISSSDDEEANRDLTLEIVERARLCEAKRRRTPEDAAQGDGSGHGVEISSASSDELDVGGLPPAAAEEGDEERKKKKRRKRVNKKKEVDEEDAGVVLQGKEAEPLGTADSVHTEINDLSEKLVTPEIFVSTKLVCKYTLVEDLEDDIDLWVKVNPVVQDGEALRTEDVILNDAPDNAVLRKLLRGPRYFDPGNSSLGSCYNCGEEGHVAADCKMEKRQKPCFVCGMFGHNSNHCHKGQDCFICTKRGHLAKECPNKHQQSFQDSKICLRCGVRGHEMLSCINDYAPDDMKEIQCYICKKFGHLCCVNFLDKGPSEVYCYNCAQPGHSGIGCAKSRGETNTETSVVCYKCGKEGHFARGCTKSSKHKRRMGESLATPQKLTSGESSTPHWRFEPSESSAPTKRFIKSTKEALKSFSHSLGKTYKKKSSHHEGKWNMTPEKSRSRGGWIVDDPGGMPLVKHKANSWMSASTGKRRYKLQSASGGHYSSPQTPSRKHKSFLSSRSPATRHSFSSSRFGKYQDYYGRN